MAELGLVVVLLVDLVVVVLGVTCELSEADRFHMAVYHQRTETEHIGYVLCVVK